MGDEFYYLDEKGNKQDAALHEDILAGDHDDALEVSRRLMRKMGLNPDTLLTKRAYNEADHPRDEHGRWTDSGGGDEDAPARETEEPKPVPEPERPNTRSIGRTNGKPWPKQDTGTAKKGDTILVLRLGSENESLFGRNGGNSAGVASHLSRVDDFEAPQFVGGHGDTINAYRVTLQADTGAYAASVGGKAKPAWAKDPEQAAKNKEDLEKVVGREVKEWQGIEGATIAYYFPGTGNGFEHEFVGSVSLTDVRAKLNEIAGTDQFDGVGTVKAALAIEAAFEDRHSDGKTWHPGEGYSKEAFVKDGVIHTGNVNDAARALHEDRKVQLDQPRQLSVLIDRLGAISKQMIADGKHAPNFNLCNVTVRGTSLFCASSKDIPRIEMPQFYGDENVKFAQHLIDKGYKLTNEQQFASHLKATQNELNGVKVADIAGYLRDKPEHQSKQPIFVSNDDYILDGHHRWAAKIGLDAADNILGNTAKMNIARVDIDIGTLLQEANDFGARRADIGEFLPWDNSKPRGFAGVMIAMAILRSYNEADHPRDEHGRWTDSGGGGSSPAESLAQAEASHRARLMRVKAALDKLPIGYEIKAGARTYTHTDIGGDKFWISDKGSGYTAAQLYEHVGHKALLPHIGHEALGLHEDTEPLAGTPSLTSEEHTFLVGTRPSPDRLDQWDKQLEARSKELADQGKAGNDEDYQIGKMQAALNTYRQEDEDNLNAGKAGLNAVYHVTDNRLLAVSFTHVAEKMTGSVAKIQHFGATSHNAGLKALQHVTTAFGSRAGSIESQVLTIDGATQAIFEAAGFKPAARSSGQYITYVKETPSGDRNPVRIKELAEATATKLDFNPELIEYTDEDKEFMLGGMKYKYAGSYQRGDSKIKLYSKHINVETVKNITAHEIGHRKFQLLTEMYKADQTAMMLDPGPPPDPNHQYWWGRKGGSDAVMKPDGTLRPPYDTKYPIYEEWTQVQNMRPSLEQDDGITNYSKLYWREWEKGEVRTDTAYHETMAEISSAQAKMGKHSAETGSGWRRLYRLQEKVWAATPPAIRDTTLIEPIKALFVIDGIRWEVR